MRERFTYDIANWVDGKWCVSLIREGTFSRDAGAIARSLLERWIVGHAGELRGGRVFVYAGTAARRSTPQHLAATVRVRVFRGGLALREADPAATAYLADAETSGSAGERKRSLYASKSQPSRNDVAAARPAS